jgi:hypothetical protein
LQLFELGATDSFQVVLRAFEESWYVAFYFRFQGQHVNAAKWQAEIGGKWSPPISQLVVFAKARGGISGGRCARASIRRRTERSRDIKITKKSEVGSPGRI